MAQSAVDRRATEARKEGGRTKSAAAFRTISEVAAELEVAQHVLRFWESKFPQVRPLKRGGGRRYYRPEDIELLRQIRALLYEEGYTIKGVQKLLKSRRVDKDSELPSGAARLDAALAAPDPRDRLRRLRHQLSEVRDMLRTARD